MIANTHFQKKEIEVNCGLNKSWKEQVPAKLHK